MSKIKIGSKVTYDFDALLNSSTNYPAERRPNQVYEDDFLTLSRTQLREVKDRLRNDKHLVVSVIDHHEGNFNIAGSYIWLPLAHATKKVKQVTGAALVGKRVKVQFRKMLGSPENTGDTSCYTAAGYPRLYAGQIEALRDALLGGQGLRVDRYDASDKTVLVEVNTRGADYLWVPAQYVKVID